MELHGIHSKRVLYRDELVEATVFVEGGRIGRVEVGVPADKSNVHDVGDLVVMPGLIDSHVHINEPGRTEWEGFDTATKAAAAGGITTLIEMPLNSDPVTTTRAAFEEKQAAARGKLHVNCGFWGGIVPNNLDDLDELLSSGVFGVKAFLTHSGIDEFPNVTEDDLRRGLPMIKKHKVPLLVHAELDSPHEGGELLKSNPTSYLAYLQSRPRSWEDEAIKLLIDLSQESDVHIHVVHLSSSNSISQLHRAMEEGVNVTVETCPHYLFFNAEEIPDGTTSFKCAPPIREQENNELLWQALNDGLFSFIVTDHSPAVPEIKELTSGNLLKAWGGIAGLQFSLPAVWTKARDRGFSIPDVCQLMSWNVAKFLGLEQQKGKIEKGYDADLVIWDSEGSFEVTKDIIEFRHKVTPYEGYQLTGRVSETYVAGHKVYGDGSFHELSKGVILKK